MARFIISASIVFAENKSNTYLLSSRYFTLLTNFEEIIYIVCESATPLINY